MTGLRLARHRVSIRPNFRALLGLLLLMWQAVPAIAAEPLAAPGGPLTPLGPQDTVTLHIDEDPTLGGLTTVADDGTLRLPYVGSVQVGGLSPDAAARRAEQADQLSRTAAIARPVASTLPEFRPAMHMRPERTR